MPEKAFETDFCSCENSSGVCGPCQFANCYCDSDGYAYCVESGACGSWYQSSLAGNRSGGRAGYNPYIDSRFQRGGKTLGPKVQKASPNRSGGKIGGINRFASGGRAGRSRHLGVPIKRR